MLIYHVLHTIYHIPYTTCSIPNTFYHVRILMLMWSVGPLLSYENCSLRLGLTAQALVQTGSFSHRLERDVCVFGALLFLPY